MLGSRPDDQFERCSVRCRGNTLVESQRCACSVQPNFVRYNFFKPPKMLMRLRWQKMTALVSFVLLVSYLSLSVLSDTARPGWQHLHALQSPVFKVNCKTESGGRTTNGAFHWGCYEHKHPVSTLRELPSAIRLAEIPKIQASPRHESPAAREIRLRRLEAVKSNFTHAWSGYKKYAWLRDGVAPLSGGSNDRFGGWAAILVDSLGGYISSHIQDLSGIHNALIGFALSRVAMDTDDFPDTLWIMGLYDEFEEAVKALDSIDFTTCSMNELNVFETTIRYLGGFLAAYDLSGGNYPQLLQKAFDLGEMLYAAFDTPNQLPLTRWEFKKAARGEAQEAHDTVLVAEMGSLTLEFTRLSQLTGDPRFYDAVQRIMDVFDEQQMTTKIPGLWPVVVDGKKGAFSESGGFTIGGMVDSLYEYLPKQHLLLGGATQQYQHMYERALAAMKSFAFSGRCFQTTKTSSYPARSIAMASRRSRGSKCSRVLNIWDVSPVAWSLSGRRFSPGLTISRLLTGLSKDVFGAMRTHHLASCRRS